MLLFLGLYTVFLIIIWGFFIVAKIHAHKFKSFSDRVVPVTRILLVVLLILSLLWYALIFYKNSAWKYWILDFKEKDFYFNEINY